MLSNWIKRWRATWNPNMYHGWGMQKSYFEGWYFKLVDPTQQQVFAVIPGISKASNGESHAFIQVLDGKQCKASYHHFPSCEFVPDGKKFALHLGDNFFSASQVRLNLPELAGSLTLKNPHPWPKMLGAPGIMGWYSFVPFMECYHGVVSLHHQLSGSLRVYGDIHSFDGGIGYIEKDWGTSFPRSWIWMQSNHFGTSKPICLMASVAHIPWLNGFFIGYIVGFLWEGTLYRFATYTGAMMKASLDGQSATLSFKDKNHLLEIKGVQGPGANLVSPLTGEMTGKVNESMQGTLEVWFYEKEKLLYHGIGRNAGLEIAGEYHELLTSTWRR